MTGKAGRRRRRRGAVGVCGRPLPFPRRHADLSPFSFPHLLLAFYGYSTRRSRPRCEQRSQFSFVHSVQALSFPIRLVWSLALPSSSRIELCCKALSKLLPILRTRTWGTWVIRYGILRVEANAGKESFYKPDGNYVPKSLKSWK